MIALISATVLIRGYKTIIEKLRSIFSKKYFLSRLSRIVVSIFAVVLLIFPFFERKLIEIIIHTLRDTLPVTKQMRDKYLSKKVKAFNLLQIANKTPLLNIYQIGFEDSFYFAEGKMIGDWFGPARYAIILDVLTKSKKLHATLNSMNIQLFLININRGIIDTKDFDIYFPQYFELIAEDYHGKLYRLKSLSNVKKSEYPLTTLQK
jgi:hypothetical protein